MSKAPASILPVHESSQLGNVLGRRQLHQTDNDRAYSELTGPSQRRNARSHCDKPALPRLPFGFVTNSVKPVPKRPRLKPPLLAKLSLLERPLSELRHNFSPVFAASSNQRLALCHGLILAMDLQRIYPSRAERLL